MKDAHNRRLRLVESAKQRGLSGLVALWRARHHQPQKTPATTEAQLVELRKLAVGSSLGRFPYSTLAFFLSYLVFRAKQKRQLVLQS